MDVYSLKKDNRKKFQDKEKLKRKHATPSDRKYRALNKKAETEERAAEEENKPDPLESNSHRYTSELLDELDAGSDDDQIIDVNAKIKQILLTRGDEEPFVKSTATRNANGSYTKKQLENMSVSQLNEVLLNRETAPTSAASEPQPKQEQRPKTFQSSNGIANSKDTTAAPVALKSTPSSIPNPLKDDEDFLDSMI
ncbi:unnamed protein product [Kluyveromyces dobzhanskii CBS 2104]|uniref:WGS project CCBQ000000000 data, contig 00028 n=1 Tax=Kluyveromyces dobzhanskii CBS 2104 TaxID=1427455 RepID=A0A0A8L0V5_9SACH|nr:unnamed protein product [Kluyveromyces dobzhanskii CBS 2104]